MKTEIKTAFDKLPAKEILTLAKNYQQKIIKDSSLIEQKAPNDFVTIADREIQKLILDYFAQSEIAGQYNIQAEETLSEHDLKLNETHKAYTLLIDPLDGTGSFCRGEEKWGCMVGLYQQQNQSLIYSWNLVASGEIFSASEIRKPQLLADKAIKTYDIYDYGGKSAKLFPQKLEDLSLGKYKKEQIQVTSHPTAVWTGFELFNRRLDGLLWLPSDENRGKGHYPNYDLIFIGALKNHKVLIGKELGLIQVLAIAESNEELILLKNCALELMQVKRELVFENGTKII